MERLWEVDAGRGVALILMLFFNWSKTLDIFGIYTVSSGWLYQYLFPRFIASMFLFIAGISLTLSINRFRKANPDNWEERGVWKYLKRALYIFGLGMAITAVTYVLFPEMFVFFGILHVIGVSIALAYPGITRPFVAGGLGALAIALSPLISGFKWMGRLGASIGFSSQGIATLDLFPLVPWVGAVLLGITAGHLLFPEGERRWSVPRSFSVRPVEVLRKLLSLTGRYTLSIYLIHQPFLVAVLYLLGFGVL